VTSVTSVVQFSVFSCRSSLGAERSAWVRGCCRPRASAITLLSNVPREGLKA